jgi:uncharacterized membrane protein
MRKILSILAMILMVSTATATTISSEDVIIDLADNSVHAEVKVDKLTSSDFTYISTAKVLGMNATVDGESVECQVSDLTLGSEIQCPTQVRENFTVTLDYGAGKMISEENGVNIFRYRHPVYRPTESYHLEVVLPRGAALVDQKNTSQQVISPGNYETGSNGRRIFVSWDRQPRLGETVSFFVLYESLVDQPDGEEGTGFLVEILAVLAAALVLAAMIVRHKRRDLSDEYDELSDDQKKVIELLEENEGEYLQKDLVQELDYSKAKVSGIVSELVDKGIVKKTKEGRSNKLSISRKYRY